MFSYLTDTIMCWVCVCMCTSIALYMLEVQQIFTELPKLMLQGLDSSLCPGTIVIVVIEILFLF